MTDIRQSVDARPAIETRAAGDARPPSDLLHRARSSAERRSDHAAIDVLARELVPALIAKLAATGLGELEVREGAWRVRLRLPGGPAGRRGRGEGPIADHAASAGAARRSAGRDASEGTASRPGHQPHQPHQPHAAHSMTAASRGGAERGEVNTPGAADPSMVAATSPAVGYYSPGAELTAGNRVAAGDRIGTVDVLGVRQEVVAPVDGILGGALAEAGQAVEYGQALVWIVFADSREPVDGDAARNLPTEEGAPGVPGAPAEAAG